MDEITVWPSQFAQDKAESLQAMGWFISRDRLHAISPATGMLASLAENTASLVMVDDNGKICLPA